MKVECPGVLFVATHDTFATKLFDQLFFFASAICYNPRRGAFAATPRTVGAGEVFSVTMGTTSLVHNGIITPSVRFVRTQNLCIIYLFDIFLGSSMVEQLPVAKRSLPEESGLQTR